jgi:hypothetical protein
MNARWQNQEKIERLASLCNALGPPLVLFSCNIWVTIVDMFLQQYDFILFYFLVYKKN